MKLKTLGLASCLALSFVTTTVSASDSVEEYSDGSIEYQSVKASPEVTFDKVQDIFGFNLDKVDGLKEMLLLAIGMDHTTPGSPFTDQYIGIPYIVDKGPEYWVQRLANADYQVEVLVNNALLLLFADKEIPNADEGALKLLTAASKLGYWPAEFYVADHNLTNKLTQSFALSPEATNLISDGSLKAMAKDTMDKFSKCAQMGFAPCQYRLGFWLSSSQDAMKNGLDILRSAIKTTMADKRYQSVMDSSLILAAKEIVMKGDFVGIDRVVRQEYLHLMKNHMANLESDFEATTKELVDEISSFLENS